MNDVIPPEPGTAIDPPGHPTYWKEEKHGRAWDKVMPALRRDWEQTKADVKAGGKELNQQVGDTLRQATGKEAIPANDAPNPAAPKEDPKVDRSWARDEPGLAYGVWAREEYGLSYPTWNAELEAKLEREWVTDKSGRRFKDVKTAVRRGWDAQR